ncbi:MAG: hypothetical protein WBP13_01130 [Methylophilaceae bacterium]
MLNYFLLTSGLVVFLALPGTSIANPRGIIYSEGKKPSRVVYVAEFLNIYDRSSGLNSVTNANNDAEFEQLIKQQKKMEMRVIAVYENKVAPESIDMMVEFQCHQKQYRITTSHAMLRDGTERFPTQDWQSYGAAKSAWPMAAAEIACDQERIKKATNEVEASKNGEDFTALDKLGILYIGEPDRLETVDKVWQAILSDGSRPKYADRKLSDKEAKAYHDKMDASLALAKENIAKGMAMAMGELSNIEEEKKFKKEVAKNAKKHGKQLKWILGKTDAEIQSTAGVPFDSFTHGEARFFTYYNEYVIDGVGYVRDVNGNDVGGSTTVTCEVQIEMRKSGAKQDYRAVDYRLFADNGGCRDLSWFNKF